MAKKKPLTLEQFRAARKVLSTQKAISRFIEQEIGIDYDTDHPYYIIHVYPGPSYINERENGTFYVEIENTCEEGTREELEQILFDWASPIEN